MLRIFTVLWCSFGLTMAFNAQAGQASEHLAQAVRFKTVSYGEQQAPDAAEFAGFRQFLRDTYPLVFSQLQVELVADHSLLITWPGSQTNLQPVLFLAHYDVVPIEPGTEHEWDHPPFAGVIADGMIYGRGTLDDKVGVIALLEAAEALLGQGFQPPRSLYFAFGHDEEISGNNGAANIAALLQQRGLQFEFSVDEAGVIVADNPLLPDKPLALINTAEKGYITLTLRARGLGGHSSRPPPHTAIGTLAAALAKLENNPMPAKLVTPVDEMLQVLAEHVGGISGWAMGNQWLTRPLLLRQLQADINTNAMVHTTTAITVFNGGVKDNVVPQIAEAKVNFRRLPGDSTEAVVEHVRQTIDNPDIEIIEQAWMEPPPVASSSGRGFKVIEQALLQEYPTAVAVPGLVTGATDSRHFTQVVKDTYRFHGMLLNTEQVDGIHGTNERIGVESFEKTVAISKHLLKLAAAAN